MRIVLTAMLAAADLDRDGLDDGYEQLLPER
jgi:hypothetical protein